MMEPWSVGSVASLQTIAIAVGKAKVLMDEQNHSERVTKQWKENVVCVYEEGRGGGILT